VSVATLSLWAIFIRRLVPGLHSTRKDALVTADQSRQDSADSVEQRKQSLCPDPSHCIVRRRLQATSQCGSPESGTFRSTGKDPSLASPAFAQNHRCPAHPYLVGRQPFAPAAQAAGRKTTLRGASSRAVASDRAEPGLGDGLRCQPLGVPPSEYRRFKQT
jgi:hypothetical protein